MLFRSGLLELLSSLGLVSKIVLLILLIFSIGSWTVILYKWRFFRRQEAADLRFLKTYRRNESPLAASRDLHLHRDSSAAAVFAEVARCYQLGGNGNPGSRLAIEGVGEGEAGLPTQRAVERVLAHAIQEQISRTETDLPFLATTGNITPFIGLLGTVLGIIDAFREIGVQERPASRRSRRGWPRVWWRRPPGRSPAIRPASRTIIFSPAFLRWRFRWNP